MPLCTLDRNGLRPARFCITRNRCLTIASETGVWDYAPEDVVRKGKLGPGDMIALDLETGTLLDLGRHRPAAEDAPSLQGLAQEGRALPRERPGGPAPGGRAHGPRHARALPEDVQRHPEERDDIIRVLAQDENEAVGSMGDDTPMPVLSHRVRSLYDYFRQQFAQVTNPPIDPLRESIVMSLQTQIGPESQHLRARARSTRARSCSARPILSQRKLRQILAIEEVTHEFIDLQYDPQEGLRAAIARICARRPRARCARASSCCCCRIATWSQGAFPVHALLATGAVHQHLVKTGLRCKCNLLVETGTARDPHHFACLIGYGATAVYPYMAYQVLFEMMRKGRVKLDFAARLELGRSYRAGLRKGLFKIMSKMGISTIASYRSSQLFEIVGLADEVVELCFTGTESRIQGADFADLESDTLAAGAARLEPARADRAGRTAQVRARRRVPHVQPGRDRGAAGGGDLRRLRRTTGCTRGW